MGRSKRKPPTADQFIPIRKDPRTADAFDGRRVELVKGRWTGQDAAYLARDRQVEENIRALAGRQWDVWSNLLGHFVDVTQYLTDDERRWRQRPVVNVLQFWFMLMHARLTENPPILGFQPSTADTDDAMLAEVSDTIFKTVWREAEMPDQLDRMIRWLVAAGFAFLKSRVDYTRGPLILQPPLDGGMGMSLTAENDGEPEHEGQLVVDVLSPLECRGQWGNTIPWHRKRWHIQKFYLTPEECYERWGIEAEPDTSGELLANGSTGYLERLLFSSGHYGSASNRTLGGLGGTGDGAELKEKFVTCYEQWEAPCEYSEETEDSPGGRFTVVVGDKVAHDSVRPYRLKYTSPIRYFEFVGLPGRPSGSSPIEMLLPLQRSYNRGWAQILEHRALMTNPIMVIDAAAGVSDENLVARPGMVVRANFRNGTAPPIAMVAPPPLSGDVWRTQQQLLDQMLMIGNINGAEGKAPTEDASGELVKELRYNSDRFVGPTARGMVNEIARVCEDWFAILPTIWTEEKTLSYAGDDNVIRTISVLPNMWEGDVHIFPEAESMLPEGRGERQAKVRTLYLDGAWGPPGSPQATKVYLELSRFPHLGRAARPGGVMRSTAEQHLGKLAQGAKLQDVPIFEFYDLDLMLAVTDEYLQGPDFLKLDPSVQQVMVLYRQVLQGAQVAKVMNAMQREAAVMGAHAQVVGAVQGTAAKAAVQAGPPMPDPRAESTASQGDASGAGIKD